MMRMQESSVRQMVRRLIVIATLFSFQMQLEILFFSPIGDLMVLFLFVSLSEVIIVHEGQLIPNNSIVALESLGDYNATFANPLLCVTTLPSCCDTNRSGNWFPPSGGGPVDSAPDSPDLYQNWEDNQSIELHRPSSVVSVEGGLYRCEVPDGDRVVQMLYVGVYTSPNEG